MKKDELVELFQTLNIPANEGVASDVNTKVFPKIVFWDYVWEDQNASGEMFNEIETYQISFYSKKPRHEKLIKLREKLREKKCHVVIYHEYEKKDKVFHSYFSLELLV